MYNLLIAIGAALLVFAPIAAWLGPWASIFPGVVAGGAAYFFLMRRSLKQLEALSMDAQKEFTAKRVDAGIKKLQDGFGLAKWQFLVASQIHAQLGMYLYVLERYDEAKPHLEKSFVRIGQARGMLGALLLKRKEYDAMIKVFEDSLRFNKKDGFLWSTYAYCLDRAGQREKAIEALGRGLTESPSDEKLKANQMALQNNERLKMKAYGQEWWAFRLEAPPMDFVPAGMRGQLYQRKGYRTPPRERR